jgi:AcrR family transcriptional regulator
MEHDQTPESRDRDAILATAQELFAHLGYQATTMKGIAKAAHCSVGHLYKHFEGKSAMLNAVALIHYDVYVTIRDRVRTGTTDHGLDILRKELRLMCEHLVDHRALIPVFDQHEPDMPSPTRAIKRRHTAEDVALLDAERRAGRIPDLDPTALCAAIDGAVWGLLRALAGTSRNEHFLRIPEFIDEIIFTPLETRAAQMRKDTLKS